MQSQIQSGPLPLLLLFKALPAWLQASGAGSWVGFLPSRSEYFCIHIFPCFLGIPSGRNMCLLCLRDLGFLIYSGPSAIRKIRFGCQSMRCFMWQPRASGSHRQWVPASLASMHGPPLSANSRDGLICMKARKTSCKPACTVCPTGVCSVAMPSLQHGGGDPTEGIIAFPSGIRLDLPCKGKFWKQAPLINKPGNVLPPQGLILWYRKPAEWWGLCGQGLCTAALQGTSSHQTKRCCVWPTAPCLLWGLRGVVFGYVGWLLVTWGGFWLLWGGCWLRCILLQALGNTTEQSPWPFGRADLIWILLLTCPDRG